MTTLDLQSLLMPKTPKQEPAPAQPSRQKDCMAAIVLMMDKSGSIGTGYTSENPNEYRPELDEWRIQVEGTADALTHPYTLSLLEEHSLAVMPVGFNAFSEGSLSGPVNLGITTYTDGFLWIHTEEDAYAVHDFFDSVIGKDKTDGSTDLALAINSGLSMLKNPNVKGCKKHVIDLSTDGGQNVEGIHELFSEMIIDGRIVPENYVSVVSAKERAVEQGVNVYGIFVGGSENEYRKLRDFATTTGKVFHSPKWEDYAKKFLDKLLYEAADMEELPDDLMQTQPAAIRNATKATPSQPRPAL